MENVSFSKSGVFSYRVTTRVKPLRHVAQLSDARGHSENSLGAGLLYVQHASLFSCLPMASRKYTHRDIIQMPYSEKTGWLSQQEWDDHAVFCRAMGQPIPTAHKPGTPAPQPVRATAAKQPQKTGDQPVGYFDRATGKVRPYAPDHDEVQKATANWAGGLMRAGGSRVQVAALRPKQIVSYSVPHSDDPDEVHFGKVVEANMYTSSVQIQEYAPSDDGAWTPQGTHHFVAFRDVKQTHTKFPDDDEAEASLQKSFAACFFRDGGR